MLGLPTVAEPRAVARGALPGVGVVSLVPAPRFAGCVLLGTLATFESHPALLASDPKLLETLHFSRGRLSHRRSVSRPHFLHELISRAETVPGGPCMPVGLA